MPAYGGGQAVSPLSHSLCSRWHSAAHAVPAPCLPEYWTPSSAAWCLPPLPSVRSEGTQWNTFSTVDLFPDQFSSPPPFACISALGTRIDLFPDQLSYPAPIARISALGTRLTCSQTMQLSYPPPITCLSAVGTRIGLGPGLNWDQDWTETRTGLEPGLDWDQYWTGDNPSCKE